MAAKPLINTEALSEFGDLSEQAQFKDPHGQDMDYTYVPGYSDLARKAAIELNEAKRGERDPKDVTKLPVKLTWVRNQDRKGGPDMLKMQSYQQMGFRAVTTDDKGQEWLTSIPSGAMVQADGTIRTGDTILMVQDREAAMRREIYLRDQTELRQTGAENAFSARLREIGLDKVDGLEPTVETTVGSKPVIISGKRK